MNCDIRSKTVGSLKEGVQRDRGTAEQQPKGKVRRWSSNLGGCKGLGLGHTGLGVLPAAGDLGPRPSPQRGPKHPRVLFPPSTGQPSLWLSLTCREFHVSTCALTFLPKGQGSDSFPLSPCDFFLPIHLPGIRAGTKTQASVNALRGLTNGTVPVPCGQTSCFQQKKRGPPQRPLNSCHGFNLALPRLPRASPGPSPSPAAHGQALGTSPRPVPDE